MSSGREKRRRKSEKGEGLWGGGKFRRSARATDLSSRTPPLALPTQPLSPLAQIPGALTPLCQVLAERRSAIPRGVLTLLPLCAACPSLLKAPLEWRKPGRTQTEGGVGQQWQYM